MSYQRAVVNCRRCYAFAGECGPASRLEHEQLWAARNEAMKALETTAEEFTGVRAIDPKCLDALTACMNCDYKEARIAEIFDPSDGSV